MGWNYLPFGSVRPTGSLAARMRRDLDGFVGNLDRLAPDLIVDDQIYGADRLTAGARHKDLGAQLDPGADPTQLLWWNSETQSNWRDGWIRHVMLVGSPGERAAVRAYVDAVLATADGDGYLGIHAPDLRFGMVGENGELWAQATLCRALLGYAEASSQLAPDHLLAAQDVPADLVAADFGPDDLRGAGMGHAQRVIRAVAAAMEVTMTALPAGGQPFGPGGYSGATHGLMLTDVLDRLTDLTADPRYRQYAASLYLAYSRSDPAEPDVTLPSLGDPAARFVGHGVHTYEHLRALLVAARVYRTAEFTAAVVTYLERMRTCLTPASGPAGDERILGRAGDATVTGYEFCSIQELTDSLLALVAATGDPQWADLAESIVVNAAAGAWHPSLPAIAYLQTDNAWEMTGSRDHDPDRQSQTRYRYSCLHRQAAVCCVPNAGRLMPTYLRGAVMQGVPDELVVLLYAPLRVVAAVGGTTVAIELVTDRLAPWAVRILVRAASPARFALILRHPSWAATMTVDGVTCEGSLVRLDRVWERDEVAVAFTAEPTIERDRAGEAFVRHGPRVFALPIPEATTVTATYAAAGFVDVDVRAADESWRDLHLVDRAPVAVGAGEVTAWFRHGNQPGASPIAARLAPLGSTPLRRLTFPLA